MKRRKMADALDQISDSHLQDAVAPKKKRILPWLGAVAAVLAVVLFFRFAQFPMAIRADAVSIADDCRASARPNRNDYSDTAQWNAAMDAWSAQRDARNAAAADARAQMDGFLAESCAQFLSGAQGNQLYSPVNAYIGLAMAAELTSGQTRQQLLDALGVPDIETLRSQVSAVWEQLYTDNGKEILTLANSLWLDDSLEFRQETMDTLAHDYYASVYRQDLSSKQTLRDIHTWLNNNTGGFLKDAVEQASLPQEAMLALYSTIYFQSKWQDAFQASRNTQDTFHALSGDLTCTFMNAKNRQMNYYWGESYGAVALNLKNGSRMWFLLPDEDKSVDHILSDGEYLDMIAAPYEGWENSKYMKVNLSVPKFDVRSTTDLKQGLEAMGITDLFAYGKADFSEAFDGPAFITAANQSVRVAIDEQGVKAAAYIELPGAGAAMPPEEIIDFVLDRPFLFVITGSSGIPLFIGVVNQP